MSEQPTPNTPFKTLGTHLKYLREQSQESLAEASGAVEIDELDLTRIEAGVDRPAEDILMLLINHYGMQDQEAVQLWELAGYDGAPDVLRGTEDELTQAAQKAVVMMLALDNRVMYSDGLDIHCNQAGVTLTFTQAAAGQAKPSAVSRVGMSYEQAGRMLQAMQHVMIKAEQLRNPKNLPPGQIPENS